MTAKKRWYRELHWQVLGALVLAVAVAQQLPGWAVAAAGMAGEVFLRLLKMVIIPLVFASLACGVARLPSTSRLGRLGLATMLYYTISTTMAVAVGLMLVNVIHPGSKLRLVASAAELPALESSQKLTDILLRLIPENPIASMARGEMLATIFFALLVGVFASSAGDKAIPFVDALESFLEVIQRMTLAVIRLVPLGVFGLVVKQVARSGLEAVVGLFPYLLTVAAGLLIHAFLTLPAVLALIARRKPLEYGRAALPALVTAFSTASSSATLPLTMECAQARGGIRREVASFVLPLGATVNMDGTALYEAVAALTIAQFYGVALGVGQQLVVLITALLASVGAAGIPMAGLVMLVVVLQSVGLPLEGIGMIIAVDRILDMMRTATNVWSDMVGAAVVDRIERR